MNIEALRHPHARRPSPTFTLRQLECFVAVAETGSMSAAAALLNASDSAVSDALTAMERTVGAVLFNRRRSRGASLTSDGLTILSIARRMLNDAEELNAAVGSDPSTITGPVRLGAVDTLGPVLVPSIIVSAARSYPAVRIEFRTGDQPTLVSLLTSGELDLLLTFDVDVPPELNRRSLFSTEACLVVSRNHRLANNESASLDEVADEPMVLLDISSSRVHTLELMSSRQITPRIAYRTHNYELCRSLVGRGLGYSLLMRRNLDAQTWDGGEVVFIPIQPSPRVVDILVVWQRRPTPPRVGALIELTTVMANDQIFRLSSRSPGETG